MRRQQSGQSVSRFASRQRAAILSDTIVHENLELLQINYLSQKVDFFLLTDQSPVQHEHVKKEHVTHQSQNNSTGYKTSTY
jgi:hypothetical protein